MAMENLDTLLTQWRSIEPAMIEIINIKVDPAFQPRNERLPPFKDQGRMHKTSQHHEDILTGKLGDGRELDPLLIARIDGCLYLIDGHHRLAAYQREVRTHVPACVRDSTELEAFKASLAVNCDYLKLPMHPEQCREAAWQYIAILTKKGKREWPKDISRRDIGRTFGVSHDTIATMAQRAVKVNIADFTPEACHPGTRWPHWKWVKGNAWRDIFNDVSTDIREQHRVERLAIKYGKDIEKYGFDVFRRAVELIDRETEDEKYETIRWCEEQGWDY